jgi:hypothetical protein
VVWHPCPRRKAHKKGLNIVSKKSNFEFQHITSDKIEKIIDKINIKKVYLLVTLTLVILMVRRAIIRKPLALTKNSLRLSLMIIRLITIWGFLILN